jgi:hypothetical protein
MVTEGQLPAFTAFLSHRYKSPEANLYFFRLFSEVAQVQFEVDDGTLSTNVTRLERMIRSANAFIGIYPFSGTPDEAQSPEELRKASRYFRLELDLAIRSRKPAIIFYDERYGNLLKCPDNVLSRPFNSREIIGAGKSPSAKVFADAFEIFCKIVTAQMSYDVALQAKPKTSVGIALPQEASGGKYTADAIRAIEGVLEKRGYDEWKLMRWPPVLARDAFVLFQDADWMLTDIGEEMAATGIPAYLHGQFVPMIRLKYVSSDVQQVASPLEKALFGGVEVGYGKDILVWNDVSSLAAGLDARLLTLKANFKRINTASEAEAYFRSAALRKEAVFLSYSGKDREIAADLSAALKKQFQQVFDYRDGKSIRPGQPWLEEIFEQLSSSAIGIPLLSPDYFASGNCEHEALQMVANHDNGKMQLIPVKLYKEPFDAPAWLQNIQYLRFPDYGSAEGVVKAILEFIAK